MLLGLKLRPLEMPMFLYTKKKLNAFFAVFQSHTAVTELNIIGTKCNRLTQQFIGISTTIDTWATCFDSTESSSGPQRLQIQFYKVVKCTLGSPVLT